MKKVLVLLLLCCFVLTGCAGSGDQNINGGGDNGGGDNGGGGGGGTVTQPVGFYVLTEMSENSIDTAANYVYKTLSVTDGKVIERELTTFGGVSQRELTLTETDGAYGDSEGRSYTFGENGLTVEKTAYRAVYVLDNDYTLSEGGESDFYGELFGEDQNTQNIYNYCPSIFMEDNRTMHIYYCKNKTSGNVTDYVAYRKGLLRDDGKWTFTEADHVLEPTAGTWDSRHVCDPDVVKGEFSYLNESYSYLMAYLGCVTSDNSNNEVGLAVAKAPEGPWVKTYVDDAFTPLKPFVKSSQGTGVWEWGYGQPSLVNTSKAGEVMLFYTQGIWSGTGTVAERWDFSNLDNPVRIESKLIAARGVQGTTGSTDIINNADFAYDAVNRRIYAISESHPINAEEGRPDFISSHNQLIYINEAASVQKPFGTMFTAGYMWRSIGFIAPINTGFERNHNMGIITDPYGWVINADEVPIVYTMSEINKPNNSLWTYRLHGYKFEV